MRGRHVGRLHLEPAFAYASTDVANLAVRTCSLLQRGRRKRPSSVGGTRSRPTRLLSARTE
jgi:hypothetical protein